MPRTRRYVATAGLGLLCFLALMAGPLSLINTDFWLVRVLDFIREPAFYGGLMLAALSIATAPRWRLWLVGGFVLFAGIQFWRFGPYTPIAPEELALADKRSKSCFSVLSLNVRMDNHGYGRIAKLVAREDPDILLLMETDQRWLAALEGTLARFGYRLSRPLDNYYGMTFASKIPVASARMIMNTSADTPTLYATLTPAAGRAVEFIGLHPRPPIPGQSTATRDANIARAGAKTPDGLADAFAMGDFNDVPWSHTSRRFKQAGQYRDPRVGRGTFATFPADHTWVGWPLDQLMVKGGVEVAGFAILESVGSDHRPVLAQLCVPSSSEG